jgi:hypothetical protein
VDREAVDDFLATSGAILDDDWEVSDDAMRWTPQEQREAPLELTSIASRCPQPRPIVGDFVDFAEQQRQFNEVIERHQQAVARAWAGAMRDPGEQPSDERQGAGRVWAIFYEAPVSPTVERYTRVFREGIERVQRDEAFMDIMRINEEMRSYADLIPAVPLIETPEPRTRPGDDITDPRERALYLRRTRNTGPTQRQRAPRRIDAHRGRG